MRVLKVAPGQVPVTAEISGTLESMQTMVGGTIQAIYPFADAVSVICNDDGKLLGLPLNRALYAPGTTYPYDIITGTFFICGVPANSGSFTSLTEAQIQKYKRLFAAPESFLFMDGRIHVIYDRESV